MTAPAVLGHTTPPLGELRVCLPTSVCAHLWGRAGDRDVTAATELLGPEAEGLRAPRAACWRREGLAPVGGVGSYIHQGGARATGLTHSREQVRAVTPGGH